MPLDERFLRRIAFIRYLYNTALEQSQRPEPMCSSSVLTFHDSVELFLQLSTEYLDVRTGIHNFMDYWEVIDKEKKIQLAQKSSMRTLNEARVGLKHHGNLPAKLAIEGFRASVTNFFRENTPLVFGIDFFSVSLIELVQCEASRNNLIEAQKLLEAGSINESLNNISLAFSELLDDYEKRKKDRYYRSPFFFGESMAFQNSFSLGISRDSRFERRLADFVDKVSRSIEALQEALKILSLGIDYRRYARFRLLTPIIMTMASGRKVIHEIRFDLVKISRSDVQFCIDFVIESAITLQEFDFTFQE